MSIDRADRCDGRSTTVALDHGTFNIFGVCVFVFGTPGHSRFEEIQKILSKGADCAIIVTDVVAARSDEKYLDQIMAFIEMCSSLLPAETPILIAISKIDLLDDVEVEIAVEDIKTKIKIPKARILGFLPISAVTGFGIDHLKSYAFLSAFTSHIEILKAVHSHGKDGLEVLAKTIGQTEADTLTKMQQQMWRQLVVADWEFETFRLPTQVLDIIEILECAKELSKLET